MRLSLLFVSLLFLLPTTAYAQFLQIPPSSVGTAVPGQIPGTTTNDNACTGCVGESQSITEPSGSATVTITIASPAVITWTGHGLVAGNVVNFTTTGALPTGITAGTNYYVIAADLGTNTFEISTTPFGSAVNTSGSQSGTQTGVANATLTSNTAAPVSALSLTAGDWGCDAVLEYTGGSTTVVKAEWSSINTSVAHGTEGQPGNILQSWGTTGTALFAQTDNGQTIPTTRFSLSGTTTVSLIAWETFTTSTSNALGNLVCRRVR